MADRSLSLAADAVCVICEATARLDEHGRCRACVVSAERRAIALQDLDAAVTEALENGVTREELHAAVDLSVDNHAGTLAKILVAREPVDTIERAIWEVSP